MLHQRALAAARVPDDAHKLPIRNGEGNAVQRAGFKRRARHIDICGVYDFNRHSSTTISSTVITSFAGLRAHEDGHEFIIEEVADAKGFIDCAGIESPGLTSSPAIGEMVADLLKEKMHLEEKKDFIATRKGVLNPNTLSKEERAALIKEKPEYGNIICRCEMITEGEIIDAIRRPLGAKSLDGVKRRTRAGMGRCQAGFCSPRTMEILARERGVSQSEITKSGGNSRIIVGTNKDSL